MDAGSPTTKGFGAVGISTISAGILQAESSARNGNLGATDPTSGAQLAGGGAPILTTKVGTGIPGTR